MRIQGYTESSFFDGAIRHPVYRRGQGPGVLIMHELLGLTPDVIRFANWIVDAGFTVFVPCLFGKAGSEYKTGGSLMSAGMSCIRREFSLLASRKSSPITQWLRALCRSIYEELGGRGVGAIGMCLTGNFALSLMVDEFVMAPVLSQPSMPLSLGKTRKAALHLSDTDLAVVKRRCRQDGVTILGLRFSEDMLCTKERFATLRSTLGDGFEGIEIDSTAGNAHGIGKRAHSVLTGDLVDESGHPTAQARDRVIEFLRARLLSDSLGNSSSDSTPT